VRRSIFGYLLVACACGALLHCPPSGASLLATSGSSPAAASLASDRESGTGSGDDSHPVAVSSRSRLWAAWNTLRGDPYPLDELDRLLAIGQRLSCDARSLVAYRGRTVSYRGTVWVNPAFQERLERFEAIVREVALETYGRAPLRLDHLGAYSCRSTRHHAGRLSEHALGNALDVAGFEFAPAQRHTPVPPDLPRALRGAFQIRVAQHWTPRSDTPVTALHAHFLHELAARCEQRSDLFRVLIGPSQKDHADHFHFDMSPWHYVNF
jgi:hypothetical protein